MASVGLGSPLQSAAREGNLEIVDMLIAAGADVDDGNSISTPLLTAIEEGLTPIKDPEGLAARMYDFCSDIVDQGCGSVESLVKRLRSSDYPYFWWD